MTKIKICGIRLPQDTEYLNEALPDYAGFIFAKYRRRYITPEQARALKARLDPRILTVGVFVDESIDVIADTARGTLDLIQLHGRESEETIRRVKALTGLPVIKAFPVYGEESIGMAEESCADMVLLDSGAGGTGESFPHELLSGIKRPFMLAGGLDPENAAEAVKKYSPFAVDVSSGVETNGAKDRDKILRFIKNIRKADEEKYQERN